MLLLGCLCWGGLRSGNTAPKESKSSCCKSLNGPGTALHLCPQLCRSPSARGPLCSDGRCHPLQVARGKQKPACGCRDPLDGCIAFPSINRGFSQCRRRVLCLPGREAASPTAGKPGRSFRQICTERCSSDLLTLL